MTLSWIWQARRKVWKLEPLNCRNQLNTGKINTNRDPTKHINLRKWPRNIERVFVAEKNN